MKRLITTIVLAIMTILLAGCYVVEGHYHRWHGPDAVIITRPAYPHYPHGHHYRGWHGHHGYHGY